MGLYLQKFELPDLSSFVIGRMTNHHFIHTGSLLFILFRFELHLTCMRFRASVQKFRT